MKPKVGGFLLVDALVAATILAITVGAVAGAIASQDIARERSEARMAAARCFDAALAAMAADSLKRSGLCGEVRWSVSELDSNSLLWLAVQENSNDLSLRLPSR